MGDTAYIALSGLRTRLDQLERLAGDLSNAQITGYKAERTSFEVADRPRFDDVLQSAVDVRTSVTRTDFHGGEIVTTGRELDVALEGAGFLVIQTPQGDRYTRNGHLQRSPDGTLVTPDGAPVLGEDGPIALGTGSVAFDPDGTVRAGKTVVGRLRIAEFADVRGLSREGSTRFSSTVAPIEAPATAVRSGALEQSNVSVVERLAELTEVTRAFEGLQRGVSLLMNDLYGRAIGELGRR